MSNAPHELWKQSRDEHPNDDAKARERYRALMVEHGHIISGKQEPLPCGWSFPDAEEERKLDDDLAKMAGVLSQEEPQ